MAKKIKTKQLSRKTSKTKTQNAKPHSRAQRAVAKHAATKTQLQYIPWHRIPLEDLNPLLQRQFVVGQKLCWRECC